MQELSVRAVPAELVTVLAFERRTTRHAAVAVAGQPLADRLQPGIAIVVVERLARTHLGDAGRRVQRVGVDERHHQPLCERRPHRRLPRSRDTHHHDDRRRGGYSARLRFHSTQPTPLRPSGVATLAHTRGNWLTRPSAAVRRTGACPYTWTSALSPPRSRSSVASSGKPLGPKASRESTVCSSVRLPSAS